MHKLQPKKSLEKYIYHFGPKKTEGSAKDIHLLGRKGANLAEMSKLGLPVPPGFTLSTELCERFFKEGKSFPEEMKAPIVLAIQQLESLTGKIFNDDKHPLLLSVRSGAPVSMPGMMDTILNLGLNEQKVQALSRICKNERFAWDTYRRFIQMYSSVVMKMNASLLEVYLEDYKNQNKYVHDSEIKAREWQDIVQYFKEAILQNTGQNFPEDPWEQLWAAIQAVFKSWNNPRAWFFYKTDIEQIKSKLLNGKLEKLNKRANKIRAGRTFIPKEHIKIQIHLDIFNHIIHFIQKNNIGITPALFLLALNLLKKEKMLLKVNIHNL